jgi:hypothetical protein
LSRAKVLHVVALILLVAAGVIGVDVHFFPMTYPSWVEETHKDDVKLLTFPRVFLFVKIDFDVSEKIRGNVTFCQDQVPSLELMPQCYVVTTDGFNGRGSNPSWLVEAIYICGGELHYEPLQYSQARYTRYFSFRANATEYYFVLLFSPAAPGSGIVYLSRLKTEISPITTTLIKVGVLAPAASAVLLLLSFSLERRKKT